MHMCIRALVYAPNKEEARELGESIFQNLVEQSVFDYYDMDDIDERWEHPVVTLVKDKTGKVNKKGMGIVNQGMEYTLAELNEALDKIRGFMEHSNEDIIEEKMDSLARHYFYKVGAYDGAGIWLYDQDGSGIRDNKHLNDVLSWWDCLESSSYRTKPEDIYVVCADVHY